MSFCLGMKVAGGLIGILLGIGAGKLATAIVPWLPTAVPVFWSVVAVCLSAAVGLFFGIYPAHKASKLDPIKALRAE